MILKRVTKVALVVGLVGTIALAAFLRGGYERFFFLPVAALLLTTFGLTLIAQNQELLPRRINLKVGIPLIAFLGWAALSYPGSIQKETTVFELLRLYLLVIAFFVPAAAFETDWERWGLVLLVSAVAFIEALYGIFEKGTGQALFEYSFLPHSFREVTGTFGNRNHFAAFMNLGIFSGLAILASRDSGDRPRAERVARWLILLVPVSVMLLALLLSGSRGGWFSCAAGLMFYLWLMWRARRPGLARIPLAAVVVLAVAMVFMARINPDYLAERLSTVRDFYDQPEELSLNARYSIWKSAAAMLGDHPFTGTGWGTFRWAFPAYRADRLLFGVRHAHNDYLQVAAGMGLPALILLLGVVVMFFRECFTMMRRYGPGKRSQTMMALLSGLLAVLFHELVDFSLMIPANALAFLALAGVALNQADEP